MKRLSWVVLATWGWCFAAAAEEERGKEEAGEPGVRYVSLEPSFVTNFGYSPDSWRLKYLKADVAVKVTSPEAETAVKYHLPYLRNELVLLFSRQEESAVVTPEGREQLRQQALADLREVLSQEEGQPYVDDLLFNDFVVQR